MRPKCRLLAMLKSPFVRCYFAVEASFLPVSRVVVRALTGDFLLTARASLRTRWLRRMPVLRGLVRFFGLPICVLTPYEFVLIINHIVTFLV